MRVGDRIIEVNGIRDDLLELVEQCKKNQVLRVKLCTDAHADLSCPYIVTVQLSGTEVSCINMNGEVFYNEPNGSTVSLGDLRDRVGRALTDAGSEGFKTEGCDAGMVKLAGAWRPLSLVSSDGDLMFHSRTGWVHPLVISLLKERDASFSPEMLKVADVFPSLR